MRPRLQPSCFGERRHALLKGASFLRAIALVVITGMLTTAPLLAADEGTSQPEPKNKLTVAYYDFSSGLQGYDVNIRHTFATSTAWVGAYHESDRFDQARAGYEYDYQRGWLTFVPSVQAATHGFVGATVYSEVGTRFYGIGGAGRTNLHPYWNLGFDPNDYLQVGGGYRTNHGGNFSIYTIRDVRLDTGQTNTHFYARQKLPSGWRLTVDVLREHGTGDEGITLDGWATTIDVTWRRWFVRAAEDPHVNYTPDRQFRLSTGVRF
jgi:hypothetical protein